MATRSIRRISANEVSHAVITAATRVQTELGPGLLESTYTACLQHQLSAAGVRSAAQVGCRLYHGSQARTRISYGFGGGGVGTRGDQVGRGCIAGTSSPALSYLELSGKSIGLLINFNVVPLKDGIRRFVN